jgi:Helix-turn-helix domain
VKVARPASAVLERIARTTGWQRATAIARHLLEWRGDRGERAPQIACSLGCGSQTARDAIHDFNERGLGALAAKSSRPKRKRYRVALAQAPYLQPPRAHLFLRVKKDHQDRGTLPLCFRGGARRCRAFGMPGERLSSSSIGDLGGLPTPVHEGFR